MKTIRVSLKGNLINSDSEVISYIWKSLDWELCKSKFPEFVVVNNKHVSLIDISKPDGPYIILENITNSTTKAIHVLSMIESDCVKIGRGHESDIRIGDISVSRLHAKIK